MDNQILAIRTLFQPNILFTSAVFSQPVKIMPTNILFTSAVFSQPVKIMPTFTYIVASFTNITENIFDAEE